jgi:Spy/CpxP family protein refolding chaperone
MIRDKTVKGWSPWLMALVLGLALVAVTAAWAAPGWQGGQGRGAHKLRNLSPEQAGQVFDLRQKFMNDTASVRRALWVKRAEVRTLFRAPEPDAAAIQAKLKEINVLKAQLQEKAVPFLIQVRKIVKNAPAKTAQGEGEQDILGMAEGDLQGNG